MATRKSAPKPPEGLEMLIHAFDAPSIDASLPSKDKHRLKLEGLRNRALLFKPAESGARVSERLRLTADEVRGKGRGKHGRMVTLRFTFPTLSAMREYLKTRQDLGATALFVSHAKTRPKADGLPLSPNAAWRIVQKAARESGFPHIHPHDFRHWRATQMLREGVPIDQVHRVLNHRSIRTTHLCAKTAEREVDAAGARTRSLNARSG